MKIRRLFNVLCIISFRFLLRTIRNRFRVETCHVTNPEVLKMRMNMICLNVGDYDTIASSILFENVQIRGENSEYRTERRMFQIWNITKIRHSVIFTTNLIKISTFLLEINNLRSKIQFISTLKSLSKAMVLYQWIFCPIPLPTCRFLKKHTEVSGTKNPDVLDQNNCQPFVFKH